LVVGVKDKSFTTEVAEADGERRETQEHSEESLCHTSERLSEKWIT
jgi:hypothetical protein